MLCRHRDLLVLPLTSLFLPQSARVSDFMSSADKGLGLKVYYVRITEQGAQTNRSRWKSIEIDGNNGNIYLFTNGAPKEPSNLGICDFLREVALQSPCIGLYTESSHLRKHVERICTFWTQVQNLVSRWMAGWVGWLEHLTDACCLVPAGVCWSHVVLGPR
jgi:hypothetical protein